MNLIKTFVCVSCLFPLINSIVVAQDAEKPAEAVEPMPAEFKKFEELLSNCVMRGHFTIDGQNLTDLKEELYEIKSVKKMPEGDYWQFTARIKYGKYDVTLPMPLQVKWSDKTPVITLDKVALPGLGTFDARVMYSGNRYAGTWQHGDVGGHMFGVVEKKKGEPATREGATDAAATETNVN